MILRNKIIIGSLIAIPAGAITGIVVSSSIKDDTTQEIRFDDDFILAVNTAYEATSTLIDDHNHDIVPLLGNASISYNNLERNFVLDLKPLFSSFNSGAITLEENFANLLKIGKSFGVIKTFLRYVKSTKPFLTANSLQFSSDYLNEQTGVPNSKTLEQITGVVGSEIDKQEKARDDISKYDIDGLTNVRVPAVDTNGHVYKGAILKKDVDHPSFVNPFTNKVEDATIDKRNTIREAILYQAIKMAKVADMYGQTIQFKNISGIDKINDSSVAVFTYNSSTKIGSYLSVRNHSTEAMIKILLLGAYKGMQRTFKSIATETEKNSLSVDDMRNFYKYALPTTDYPILRKPNNGMTKDDDETVKKLRSDNPSHYGVVITDALITLQNPFKFEPAMVTRASDKINNDLLGQIASSHSRDVKSYTHFYGKNSYKKFAHYASIYGKNLKNFSFYDPSHKPPKRLIGAKQREALEKSGIEWFGDTGSKPQFLNKPAMFYKSVKTMFGTLLITSGHNLITKYIKRGFREDGDKAPYKDDAFLNKIDPHKLYEDNAATIPGFNSHSELSLDHPFVLGDQDLGLVTINLARNYRTSKSTQTRKVYTKDEMMKDIFKDSANATDADLLQWFAILATMLEDKLTVSGTGPERDVNIDATFGINTSMSDTQLSNMLAPLNLGSSVKKDKGYIIFDKDQFAGKSDVIKKVFKAIFTKDNFTFANLDGIDDDAPTINKMKFTEVQIETAFNNAKVTMALPTFKKAWSKTSTSYTSHQTFAAEGDTLQNNYNKVIKDTFVKYAYDQTHTQAKPET
ncbi:MAG: hypothetical protein KAG04_02380, partial [Mycoplasmataceae bacterium]|nr:hypothetical protein [Mycoplasmataceae bacterium]